MADYELSPQRKNQVFSQIKLAKLDPADFVWLEEASEVTKMGLGRETFTVEVLGHAPTGYYFKFDVNANTNMSDQWAIRLPGSDGPRRRDNAGTWELVFEYLADWLRHVKAEHDAPDLWAEFANAQKQLGNVPTEIENTPFTTDEQNEIARQLQELKTYTRQTYELNEEQYRAIESRLDYFADAATRLPRIDWRNAFVGALLGLVLQNVVPPEPVQHLFYVVLRGLAHMFGGGDALPELPV